MKVIETEKIFEEIENLPPDARLWTYCGYDVLMPHEIHEKQQRRFNPRTTSIYLFERAMNGPAFSMMTTGTKTDPVEIDRHLDILESQRKKLHRYVQALAVAIWGQGLNINSSNQMREFFYDLPSNDPEVNPFKGLGLSPIYKGRGKDRKITCERAALEKLATHYYARPVVNAILAQKDVEGKIDVLQRGVDPDGRMRCSFNVGAADTGRWSSSKNPWGRGTNFQNITDSLRSIFEPDEGYIFCYPDLEQAESRGVAYLSGDEAYIAACESADLHTTVASMVWPDLPWTSDPTRNRLVADRIFYRHFSYRDMAKRGGHATNYLGKPWMVAKHLKVEQEIIEKFQKRYFEVFSGILRWHEEVQTLLQDTGVLITPIGRERTFFGRLNDSETLKKAVAHLPQSLISDIVKLGTYLAWKELIINRKGWAQIHGDVHDGVLWSLREIFLLESAECLRRCMTITVEVKGRKMTIPVELKVGYRWISQDKRHPHRMRNYEPGILNKIKRPDVFDAFMSIELRGEET
jgi:DNA polymerase I-like protein with 3'-5' exonuclease and polymerase domains